MFISISAKTTALVVIIISLAIQIGFALGIFGPAWLSPILTLPALLAMRHLWRRAERARAETQAFAELVI